MPAGPAGGGEPPAAGGEPNRGTHGAPAAGAPRRCEPGGRRTTPQIANPGAPMPEPTSPAPAPRSSPGRTAALIGGVLTGFVPFAVLAAGAVLLWGNSHKDRDGYLATGSDRYHTRTYALATQNLDVHTDAPNWLLDPSGFRGLPPPAAGPPRVRPRPPAAKPVFVGTARSRDVATYLRGTAHATLTDVDYSPFEASY